MPCKKIKLPIQKGGYKAGSSLKRTWKPDKNRFIRTFSEVLPDGTAVGQYIGYDYIKPDPDGGAPKLQGTAWLTAAKKAYRQQCKDYRDAFMQERVEEDTGRAFQQAWRSLSKLEKKAYQEEAIQIQCEPAVIHLRETTPENTKYDYSFRERKYYILTEPMLEPKKVLPSKGPTQRIYRYLPKVYPMKIKESIEEFKMRKNL